MVELKKIYDKYIYVHIYNNKAINKPHTFLKNSPNETALLTFLCGCAFVSEVVELSAVFAEPEITAFCFKSKRHKYLQVSSQFRKHMINCTQFISCLLNS